MYALDAQRVLRLHRQEAADYSRRIGDLYDQLDRRAVAFALPEVLEVHGDGEVSWSIERRLPGRSLDQALPSLVGPARADALRAYVSAAAHFAALGPPPTWPGGCGELLTEERLTAPRWGDLVQARLHLQLERARPVLEPAIADLDGVSARVLTEAQAIPSAGPPTLVHGDWCPGNVMVGDDLQVVAAIDLGWLTNVGDASHDVLTAAVFCEAQATYRSEDAAVLRGAVADHLGDVSVEQLDRARRVEALRFAWVTDDPLLHRWCLAALREA